MKEKRIKQSLKDFGKALDRLKEMLNEPIDANDYVLDATIHRFEFCYELCWKTLKFALERSGHVDSRSARDVFSKAYELDWINNEQLWIDMIDDRNLTSHTYQEPTAREVYEDIKSFYPELRKAYNFLNEKYGTQL